ncbi:MAG: pyridoxal phosphate-dependent aminotransferase [Prevotella sp.]|nr:pyridoxal phosphate-dependent aminotransferase [Prevotella sp.]MBQ9237472.1 pyridoxal phosphate-dependent aminotransferase [Prevotella sp.]
MLDKQIVTEVIESMKLGDFSQATIRDIQTLSRQLEEKTSESVIHLEMGVPGLQPSRIALRAEQEALASGCATQYPPNGGIPRIKKAASEFVKAFIGIDIDPLCCVPTTGSMQGTFATFTALYHAMGVRDGGTKDTVLFIEPGFPVQNTQCDVIGLKQVGLDIHGYRGETLIAKLDEILAAGNICAIVYSNPNNPSWVCFTEEELQGIGTLATKYDVIVLEDLAYFAMDFRRDLSHPYQAPYQATVARYTDNYVLWISGSKAFSYAGQRIGVTCIGNKLYHRDYAPLRKFGVSTFGDFFTGRLMYTLSSGTTHSVQHAMSALMEAACDGSYNFLDDVKEYGRRARYMKDVLLANGFRLVYDNDMGNPLADGFYFTVCYPGMTGLELTRALMYYGIAVFPLDTMGSTQQGVRICTSFFSKEQEPLFKQRIEAFAKEN